jgi:hypothetical protein
MDDRLLEGLIRKSKARRPALIMVLESAGE